MRSPIKIDRSVDAEVYNQPVLICRVIRVYHVMMLVISSEHVWFVKKGYCQNVLGELLFSLGSKTQFMKCVRVFIVM